MTRSPFIDDRMEMPPPSVDLRDQILAIMQHETYARLLTELAKGGSPVQKLLLRHRDDVFPKLDPEGAVLPEEYPLSLPLFFWEDPVESVADSTVRPSIVGILARREIDEEESEYEDDASDIAEHEASYPADNFEDLVLLNALRVLQHNPHLLRLAQQEEDVSLPQIRKALGQHGIDFTPLEDEAVRFMESIAEDQGFGMIFRSLLRRSEADTWTTYESKKIMNEMYRILSDILIEIPRWIGEIHRLLPELAVRGAPFLRQHNAYAAWVYGGNPEDYLNALDTLWDLEVLHPLAVTHICKACQDAEGNPLLQVLSSKRRPWRLARSRACSWCGERVSVQAMYGLDLQVHKWIASQDGLLSYVVAYLLEANKLAWLGRVHTNVSEHDFHVPTPEGTHVIECKVFRCSTPLESGSLKDKVRVAMTQLRAHMAEIDAISGNLVCHPYLPLEDSLKDWVHPQSKGESLDTEDGRIQVIGIEDVPRLVSRLRQATSGSNENQTAAG